MFKIVIIEVHLSCNHILKSMLNLKYVLLILCLLFATQGFSQQRFKHDKYNRLGVQGGVLYGGITTGDFQTGRGVGYTAGLTTRANVYEGYLVVYGINFYEFNNGIMLVEPEGIVAEEIDFKTTGVQLNLFAGHKIIKEHLSAFAGPVLQLNGKWTADKMLREYQVEGTTLTALDLENISKINFNAAVALNAGFKSFKFWLQYQYGLNNILDNFNSDELQERDPAAEDFRGRIKFATAGLIFYF